MKGQIAPQWFRTLDDAQEHAETEIGSYDDKGVAEADENGYPKPSPFSLGIRAALGSDDPEDQNNNEPGSEDGDEWQRGYEYGVSKRHNTTLGVRKLSPNRSRKEKPLDYEKLGAFFNQYAPDRNITKAFNQHEQNQKDKKGVTEGKGLAKKVKIVKGPDAGKTGWIREIKHGSFKGAAKSYYIDLDDGGQANNIPGTALRLVIDQDVAETAQGHTIEAHGVRGMDRKTWHKTFKNVDQLNVWAEKYDAEIHGTRDLEQAKRGNLSPAIRGVAEAGKPDVMRHRGDKTIRVVKKGGKPIGEIGIDAEASPGNGQYYVKLYDGSYDAVGFDTAAEALAELKSAISEGRLTEFAPSTGGDDGDDGFDEDTLRQLAAKWYQGDEDPRVEQVLMAAGWEIGQDEGYEDEPGVFVVMSGDEHGKSYISWPASELQSDVAEQGVAESSMYGDEEVSWEKGGRRAPTGAFRNPAADKKDQKAQARQQSKAAFSDMMGRSAADLTSRLKIREQGVAEGVKKMSPQQQHDFDRMRYGAMSRKEYDAKWKKPLKSDDEVIYGKKKGVTEARNNVSIPAALEMLKDARAYLDQFDPEDDDDYFDAYETIAAEFDMESNDSSNDPLTDLLDMYEVNPQQAAQMLADHLQSQSKDVAEGIMDVVNIGAQVLYKGQPAEVIAVDGTAATVYVPTWKSIPGMVDDTIEVDPASKFLAQIGEQSVKEDDVNDFLARGGAITQVKPNKGPRYPGTSLGSKHIGTLRGGKASTISGKNANTRPTVKPVVAVEAERNEMDTPAVQNALAKMAAKHKDEKWSKEQLTALGKRLAARGAAERKTKGVDEDSWHDGQNAWSSENNQWSNESVEDRRLNRLIEYRLAEMRRAGYDI
jgi:hypothetical protein